MPKQHCLELSIKGCLKKLEYDLTFKTRLIVSHQQMNRFVYCLPRSITVTQHIQSDITTTNSILFLHLRIDNWGSGELAGRRRKKQKKAGK